MSCLHSFPDSHEGRVWARLLEDPSLAGCSDSTSESTHCKKSNGERRRATRKVEDVLENIPLPQGLSLDTLVDRLETCARTCEACDAGIKHRNKVRLSEPLSQGSEGREGIISRTGVFFRAPTPPFAPNDLPLLTCPSPRTALR